MTYNFETSADAIRWVHDTAIFCISESGCLCSYWLPEKYGSIYDVDTDLYDIYDDPAPMAGDEWEKAISAIWRDYVNADNKTRNTMRVNIYQYRDVILSDEYKRRLYDIDKKCFPKPGILGSTIVQANEMAPEEYRNKKVMDEFCIEQCKCLMDATDQLRLFFKVISKFIPDPDDLQTDYKTMPRTHRIAAVWGLFDKLGLSRTKDRTKLAAFVEAVTGGNIEARPQDTVSYKSPTKDAKEAVSEWLKKIGME